MQYQTEAPLTPNLDTPVHFLVSTRRPSLSEEVWDSSSLALPVPTEQRERASVSKLALKEHDKGAEPALRHVPEVHLLPCI